MRGKTMVEFENRRIIEVKKRGKAYKNERNRSRAHQNSNTAIRFLRKKPLMLENILLYTVFFLAYILVIGIGTIEEGGKEEENTQGSLHNQGERKFLNGRAGHGCSTFKLRTHSSDIILQSYGLNSLKEQIKSGCN
jgi:hypothetical protein